MTGNPERREEAVAARTKPLTGNGLAETPPMTGRVLLKQIGELFYDQPAE